MKFSKKTLNESLKQPKTNKKVFTEGKRQDVILSEEQLDRLLMRLEESKQNSINQIIKECHQLIRESIKNENLDLSVEDYSYDLLGEGFDTGGYNRGVAAANGIENIINGVKKAYDMIKDSDTRKRLANSITKLGNFMTITADAIASGRDQRAMADPDSLKDPLPYPDLDEGYDGQDGDVYEMDDMEEGHHEMDEGKKKDHDGDGDIDSDDYLMAKDKAIKKAMKNESEEEKQKLIQEDIKKMKQIIKPISKI